MEKRTIIIVSFSILTISVATFVMILYHTSLKVSEEKSIFGTSGVHLREHFGTNDRNNTCSDELIIFLGDGYCDDEANNMNCLFDKGDCCLYNNLIAFTLCSDCHCLVNISETVNNFDCFQLVESVTLTNGNVGDGKCDQAFNNVDYFFDAGDCCMSENAENCIVSNFYCEEDTLGDGVCQDYNNGPMCNYDFGDCCGGNANVDECCLCQCLHLSNFVDPNIVGGEMDRPWLGLIP